ncbi:MAG: aminopeptidase [Robiginitomaculum sp.]|nr:MAG: aminopeptidase [Robiginitomaculum sp.]
MFRIVALGFLASVFANVAIANPIQQTKGSFEDKFRQLEGEEWPDVNSMRTASGSPGPDYWQQQADYKIDVTLNEAKRRLDGIVRVTYTNKSRQDLPYLWVQLDQNRFQNGSIGELGRAVTSSKEVSYNAARRALAMRKFDGGYRLSSVTDATGRNLPYQVVDTVMRIDLPTPLKAGAQMSFAITYGYNIIEERVIGGRGGYECFEAKNEDGNCIFEIAQFYPRMAVFSDYEGWHNKQFMGRGEFTLEFGKYEVSITVPADLIVAATGELQNPDEVLSAAQASRLREARTADEPVFIVTPSEAKANERSVAKGTKTWRFMAEDVRDFAFAASRKFIWDAQGMNQEIPGGPDHVMAMSFYPKEAEPLWSAYSTKSVMHTLRVYSKYSTPYPWPVAISVNGPKFGMEYPMICFNGPRPKKDMRGNLSYTDRDKYGLISVIIHEVGHNFFPMWVNSDERQWTWMDEGLNTFMQFLAEREWEENYPSRRGEPKKMAEYMVSQNQVPIMTNSESILQFGNNAYAKPATALNILRETILGREAFDRAFTQYSEDWKMKRPTPYDFFRTMEEVSGTDLDWFWRGWFYSTDHVDISLDNISIGTLNTADPEIENKLARKEAGEEPLSLTIERNKSMPMEVDRDRALLDYYNSHDKFETTKFQKSDYQELLKNLKPWEREVLKSDENYYFFEFSNLGGLVMPIILEVEYKNGRKEEFRLPAEIWRANPKKVTKMIVTDREIVSATVDPRWETADVDVHNNTFPRQITPTRLEAFRGKKPPRNRMAEDKLVVSEGSLITKAEKKAPKK